MRQHRRRCARQRARGHGGPAPPRGVHRARRRVRPDRSDRSTDRWPGVMRLTGGLRAGAGNRRTGASLRQGARGARAGQARGSFAIGIRVHKEEADWFLASSGRLHRAAQEGAGGRAVGIGRASSSGARAGRARARGWQTKGPWTSNRGEVGVML
eukprot:10749358-Alexandrium_andersonii.AAC.1